MPHLVRVGGTRIHGEQGEESLALTARVTRYVEHFVGEAERVDELVQHLVSIDMVTW